MSTELHTVNMFWSHKVSNFQIVRVFMSAHGWGVLYFFEALMTPNLSSLLNVKIASGSVFHHFEEGESTKRYLYLRDESQTVDTKSTRIVSRFMLHP